MHSCTRLNKLIFLVAFSIFAQGALAQEASTFVGAVGQLYLPPGSSPGLFTGVEIGTARKHGFGYGLTVVAAVDAPGIPTIGIPSQQFGGGATLDVRYIIDTFGSMGLYPVLSIGALVGVTRGGQSVITPIMTPGFGARVGLSEDLYASLEIGAFNVHVPAARASIGWRF